jgi:hypothetical protein
MGKSEIKSALTPENGDAKCNQSNNDIPPKKKSHKVNVAQ